MSISLSSSPFTPLSPLHSLPRPSSRDSNRSGRAHSPALAVDDPVAVRGHMSALKHSIRQQQAQLHTLENHILRGPRPLPPGIMSSPPYSPDELPDTAPAGPPSSYVSPGSATTKLQRRSSFEVLHGLAGPDSSLPLPRRDVAGPSSLKQDESIREGVPMDFGVGSVSPNHQKRISSPTRTLSRIPVSAVGNARALTDEGQPMTHRGSASVQIETISENGSMSAHPPPSPNRRISLTPGGTTKVLAELQAGVSNARHALENTRSQLRQSQRSVAQLTRQTEDLKEGRERLRLENEGLNAVVARKERLLQEVLERARKAEAEVTTLKSQLKTETTTSKKSLREMESALAESTALSQKSEREYITLRDSMKGLVEGWKTDTEKLREEMHKREEKVRKEAEQIGSKYRTLVEEVKANQAVKESIKDLIKEDERLRSEVEEEFRQEIRKMREEVEKSTTEGNKASETAKNLAIELARLRRLMQTVGGSPLQDGSSQDPPPP